MYAGLQGFVKFHFEGINPKASEPFHVYRQPETELFPQIEARTGQLRRNWEGVSRASSDFFIQYFFSYPQLTQVGGQTYLDFEVEASVSGGSYELGDAGIFIEYDTSLLGSSLAGSGKVTIIAGDVTMSTDYSFSATDYGTNVLEIAVDAADPPINLGEVDAWADDVVKVRVDVTGLTPGLDALFEQSLMQGESEYYDAASGTYVLFPFVWAVDSVVYQVSSVIAIDSIAGDTIPAGTDDFIGIYGSGFGTTAGRVLFKNADEGGASRVQAFGEDYILWTDALIVVKVPSRDTTTGPGSNRNPAGSGTIMVETAAGDTLESSDSIEIPFALFNIRQSAGSNFTTIPQRFADALGNGGIQFSFNENFPANYRVVFEHALDQWRCETGIYMTISGQETPLDTASQDGVGVVAINDLDAGLRGVTKSFGDVCFDGNTFQVYTSEVDMIFDDSADWFVDTAGTGLSPGQMDFYSIALHELGHAHHLGHSLDGNKVMFFGIQPQEIRRDIDSGSLSGGNYSVSISLDSIICTVTSSDTIPPMQLFDCSTTAINDYAIVNSLEIYPNPATNGIYIRSSEIGQGEPMQITMYNKVGQECFQRRINANENGIWVNIPHHISSGIFFISIHTTQSSYYGKLSLQR